MADLVQSPAPQVAPDIIWRIVDGNAVIVSPIDGEVHVLSETGTAIWEMVADKNNVSDIEGYLVDHYIVSQAQACQDVESFINNLKALGLIT
ncbi:MAG: PqqD family protein [Chloroflexi bacterium]|nr:PqqD family protein [Chloroflexota bacterium]